MARTQAVGIAILGAWLGGTLFMWFAATRSFRTVDRVLTASRPEFQQAVRPLGHDQTRVVLRYLASEINRTYFRLYGWIQILLGLVLVLLLVRQVPRDTVAVVLAGVMLGLVLILTLVIQPQIVSLGQSIDFVPRDPASPVMPRFWMLHGAFTGLDGVKWLAGLALLVRWILRA
ncbi:MAG TPA: DUF4149 domain-containing protein [Terriglobia bacterium]|nr:DUF4149 domain-containing protein [Terriglobia bacterium]